MATVLPMSSLTKQRASLRIGDLAKQAGKSTRAVRLYENMGLLGPAYRTDGGHRVYTDDALARLSWIDRLQALGMSLPEIRTFLDELEDEGTGPAAMARVRGMFEAKVKEVQVQIEGLQTIMSELREGLTYLETCTGCAPSTDLHACGTCDHDHSIEPPLLITGLHKRGEGSQNK